MPEETAEERKRRKERERRKRHKAGQNTESQLAEIERQEAEDRGIPVQDDRTP